MRVLELFEVQSQEGPCLDAGFHSAHALPMRLRDTVIGALNLFRTGTGQMGPADVARSVIGGSLSPSELAHAPAAEA